MRHEILILNLRVFLILANKLFWDTIAKDIIIAVYNIELCRDWGHEEQKEKN